MNHQTLASSFLLAGLQPSDRAEIEALAVPRSLSAEQFLFRKGDEASALYVTLSGRLCAMTQASSGRELVVREFHPGDVIGEIALFDREPRTASVKALEPSELSAVSNRDLRALLGRKPPLAMRFIELLALRLRQTTESLEDHAFLTIKGRMAKFILQLADMEGEETERGLRVSERVSRTWMAVAIGAAKENISNQLRAWDEAGYIARDAKTLYILNREALEEMCAPQNA